MFLPIILFVCLTGSSYARTDGEIKNWFFSLAVQCSKEHPVSVEELQMMYKHKIPEHQNAKCLLACMFRKTGWLDEKGMFDIKKAYELAETDYADDSTKMENSKKVFEICKTVNDEQVADGDKGCDRAYLMAKCMSEHGRKVRHMFSSGRHVADDDAMTIFINRDILKLKGLPSNLELLVGFEKWASKYKLLK